MSKRRVSVAGGMIVTCLAATLGFWAGSDVGPGRAQTSPGGAVAPAAPDRPTAAHPGDGYLKQSPGARAEDGDANDYGLGDGHVSKLKPYAQTKCGERTPFDLWRYAGRDGSSWSPPTLPMSWDEWKHLSSVRVPSQSWNPRRRTLSQRSSFRFSRLAAS